MALVWKINNGHATILWEKTELQISGRTRTIHSTVAIGIDSIIDWLKLVDLLSERLSDYYCLYSFTLTGLSFILLACNSLNNMHLDSVQLSWEYAIVLELTWQNIIFWRGHGLCRFGPCFKDSCGRSLITHFFVKVILIRVGFKKTLLLSTFCG